MPSPFAMKLRKFIRTRRLEDVRQLGSDRVVDFKFGSGDSVCHIILELYASGNIVLTDGSYEIQALLRSHQFDDDIAVKMHEVYPIAFTASIETPPPFLTPGQAPLPLENDTHSELTNLTPQTTPVPSVPLSVLAMSKEDFVTWARQREKCYSEQQEMQQGDKARESATASGGIATKSSHKKGGGGGGGGGGGSKKNKIRKLTMRQLLLSRESGVAFYGPEIIDHCLLASNTTPSTKVADYLSSLPPTSTQTEVDSVDLLLTELRAGQTLLALLDAPGQPGYILYRTKAIGETTAPSTADIHIENSKMEEYYDFVPRIFKQHGDVPCKEYPSFDEAVDEYFCKVRTSMYPPPPHPPCCM